MSTTVEGVEYNVDDGDDYDIAATKAAREMNRQMNALMDKWDWPEDDAHQGALDNVVDDTFPLVHVVFGVPSRRDWYVKVAAVWRREYGETTPTNELVTL